MWTDDSDAIQQRLMKDHSAPHTHAHTHKQVYEFLSLSIVGSEET